MSKKLDPMKLTLRLLTLAALLACTVGSIAQTNTPAAEAPPAAATPAPPTAAAPAPTPDAPVTGEAKPALITAPGASIPLIVMEDVPLTDAIRNLARQSGINFLLDPKIGYGQPGPDGKVIPQPSVSIRWENITADQALEALLNNYGLQKVEDPRSRIARVTPKDPLAPEP